MGAWRTWGHGVMETRGTQRHGDTGTYKDMGGHRVGKKI